MIWCCKLSFIYMPPGYCVQWVWHEWKNSTSNLSVRRCTLTCTLPLNYLSKLEIFHFYLLHTQAWLCSHAFNGLLRQLGKEPCFGYLISGGDESLIISNELPEDDPPLGKPCELWPLWCVSSPICDCFDPSWLLQLLMGSLHFAKISTKKKFQ